MSTPKPITLATLGSATAQEVFDWVVFNLLRQNARSAVDDFVSHQCKYRGPDGLKCAAGWLIADDEYADEMEGTSWPYIVDEFELPSEHQWLIGALQRVHDGFKVEDWPAGLLDVARSFMLDPAVIYNFQREGETE